MLNLASRGRTRLLVGDADRLPRAGRRPEHLPVDERRCDDRLASRPRRRTEIAASGIARARAGTPLTVTVNGCTVFDRAGRRRAMVPHVRARPVQRRGAAGTRTSASHSRVRRSRRSRQAAGCWAWPSKRSTCSTIRGRRSRPDPAKTIASVGAGRPGERSRSRRARPSTSRLRTAAKASGWDRRKATDAAQPRRHRAALAPARWHGPVGRAAHGAAAHVLSGRPHDSHGPGRRAGAAAECRALGAHHRAGFPGRPADQGGAAPYAQCR